MQTRHYSNLANSVALIRPTEQLKQNEHAVRTDHLVARIVPMIVLGVAGACCVTMASG